MGMWLTNGFAGPKQGFYLARPTDKLIRSLNASIGHDLQSGLADSVTYFTSKMQGLAGHCGPPSPLPHSDSKASAKRCKSTKRECMKANQTIGSMANTMQPA